MNFLAHLYLACKNENLMVGNFIGDAVKGNTYQNFPEGIKRGILMHREIDSFSDSHPINLRSVHRLQPLFGKYSGIINDMFCDYFLANNWNKFSTIELKEFCEDAYDVLKRNIDVMPEESQIILSYMVKSNWLYSYRSIEGINKALTGMSKRMKYYFPMNDATKILKEKPELFEEDFLEFFPVMIKHLESFRVFK